MNSVKNPVVKVIYGQAGVPKSVFLSSINARWEEEGVTLSEVLKAAVFAGYETDKVYKVGSTTVNAGTVLRGGEEVVVLKNISNG